MVGPFIPTSEKMECISTLTLMATKKNPQKQKQKSWYDNCLAIRGYRLLFFKFWELSTQQVFSLLKKIEIVVPNSLPTIFHPLISSTWPSPYDKMSLPWLYNEVDLATNRDVLHLEFQPQYTS